MLIFLITDCIFFNFRRKPGRFPAFLRGFCSALSVFSYFSSSLLLFLLCLPVMFVLLFLFRVKTMRLFILKWLNLFLWRIDCINFFLYFLKVSILLVLEFRINAKQTNPKERVKSGLPYNIRSLILAFYQNHLLFFALTILHYKIIIKNLRKNIKSIDQN